jgi:hypothetical protein
MKWFWSLIPFCAFATVNEPIRWEWLTGYRNDRIHWHLQSPGDSGALSYSERYTNIEFWENQLALRVIHRDFALYLEGSYAAFGKGDLMQRFANLSYATDQPHLKFNTDGWAADGNGWLGYAVNLTADRTYKVMLIPLLGFSGHYERSDRKGTSRFESDHAVGASSYALEAWFPKDLKQTWYGVYLGGGFRIEPGGRLIFDFGYAYHWVHLTLESRFNQTLFLYDGADLLSETTTQNKVKAKEGGNLGHSGWIELEYRINQAWRIGTAGQIRYFCSKVISLNEQQTTSGVTTDLAQKFKLRWTSISVLGTISRDF